MDLDLMHYRLDHPEKFKETFTDEGFNDFENETAEEGAEGADEASEVEETQQPQEPRPLQTSEVPQQWEDIPDEDL